MKSPFVSSSARQVPTTCISFVSQAALQCDIKRRLHLKRNVEAVRRTRQITKQNMLLNDSMPRIDIDAERFDVRIDNQRIDLKPAQDFSLGQLYWFS